MTFFISFSVIRTPMSETETSQRWSTQFLWIFAAFVLLYNAHLILEWFFCVFFSGVWQKSVQYVGQYGWSQFAQCSLSLKKMRYKSFMKATAAGRYAYSAACIMHIASVLAAESASTVLCHPVLELHPGFTGRCLRARRGSVGRC